MNKLTKLFYAGLLSLSFTANAVDYSDLKAYEIEVVIFKFKNTKSAGSEIWPDLVKTNDVEDAIELHNNSSLTLVPGVDEKAYYYSKIPAAKFRLSKETDKLTASKEYEIIYHSAWIQPGLDKENAEFIHIDSIQEKNPLSVIDPILGSSLMPIKDKMASLLVTNDEAVNNTPILEGLIKVELARYLHIYFDLKYQRDLAPMQAVMNDMAKPYKEIRYYPVQMHRRMRSKEIHYIDHPLIGILVLATPFELPEVEGDDDIAQPLQKLQDLPLSQ